MSDLGTDGKRKLGEMVETPFFTFSKPYLDFIDKGKIFSLIYIVMAVINLLIPFGILFNVVGSGVLRYGGARFAVTFIFSWIVIAFACWIGFQLWWDRRKKVAILASSEFIATPVFSEILQTIGEWLGTLVGIIGAGVGLIASIVLGRDASYLFGAIGLGFLNLGIATVIIGPVIGFFIIMIFRFFAEQLKLFASLVNNTKEIAKNLKNNANGA